MRKIPTLYVRIMDGQGRPTALVTDQPNPAAAKAFDPAAIATVKRDGTACLIRDGTLYKRYVAKPGRYAPNGWIPAQDAADPLTGNFPGWEPVGDGPQDKYHLEAFERMYRRPNAVFVDGTYELVGPKIQGNPEGISQHLLLPHGHETADTAPTPPTYERLRRWLADACIEGIVWWLNGEPVGKIKRRDFGLPWPPPASG